MPIYEYDCGICGAFEALVSISEADAERQCPRCGRLASRIVSAFAIGAAAMDKTAAPQKSPHAARRPAIPGYARPCWMDDRSAERFAAYKMGRGAEYDDKMAAREERRKQRGLPPVETHDHAHSAVAAAVARKKAQEAAKTESSSNPERGSAG